MKRVNVEQMFQGLVLNLHITALVQHPVVAAVNIAQAVHRVVNVRIMKQPVMQHRRYKYKIDSSENYITA